ncbi:UPF0481 protein At3g47200-like [Pyrus communis]|uniref:UPF0481 protein At3g47200-like n=1 Tax=Pyrus communis TaxID=23211 RepID=UPI0035C0271A
MPSGLGTRPADTTESAEMVHSENGTRLEPKERELKAKWKQEIVDKLKVVMAAPVDSCIYKVPNKLRKVKEDAYNPRVVSIGPFHRKNPDLVDAIREFKWRCMLSLLQQTEDENKSHQCFEDCSDAIYDLDDNVRQCYAETIKPDKNELAKIMLLDGCFILELFIRYHEAKNEKKGDGDEAKNVIEGDGSDPILKSKWMIAALQHDLALLENQIPFSVLVTLYNIVKPEATIKHSVASLALDFFEPMNEKHIPDELGTDFKHLLDLLHKFYFPKPVPSEPSEISIPVDNSKLNDERSRCCFSLSRKVIKKSGELQTSSGHSSQPDDAAGNDKWGFNYCAKELLESGVQLHIPSETDENLLNIKFSNGGLSIPTLIINKSTSSIFRNLIAYEQYSLSSTNTVTSYAFLMKSLVRYPEDFKLLQERKIIKPHLIGEQEYLNQFKTILDEVVAKDDFCFASVRDQVNQYCESWCHLNKLQVYLKVRFLKEIRDLHNTYFTSTWSIISFLAAFALLILTSLQTYYAIHGPHK